MIVIAAAMPHTYLFRNRYLDMIDILPVPERFKECIAETEGQNILYGLFAKKMVYAKDLPFFIQLTQSAIQITGGFKVSAKGFFHNHP